MTKEEVQRKTLSTDQRDGSLNINAPLTRTSTDKVMQKAEHQAKKTEVDGACEDLTQDRTLSAMRSPSVDRTNGVSGTVLPVVQEDGEAVSREDSMHNEKASGAPAGDKALPALDDRPPPTPPKDSMLKNKELPSIPHIPRLSMSEALRAGQRQDD